jgi:hypothetical protein
MGTRRVAWAGVAATALGLWLMAAPWALGYGAPASVVDRVVGPIAASVAWISVWQVTRLLRWLNLPLGAGLVLAPFGLGYPLVALLNSILVGVSVAALAFVPGPQRRRLGGGWAAVWRSGQRTPTAMGDGPR